MIIHFQNVWRSAVKCFHRFNWQCWSTSSVLNSNEKESSSLGLSSRKFRRRSKSWCRISGTRRDTFCIIAIYSCTYLSVNIFSLAKNEYVYSHDNYDMTCIQYFYNNHNSFQDWSSRRSIVSLRSGKRHGSPHTLSLTPFSDRSPATSLRKISSNSWIMQ